MAHVTGSRYFLGAKVRLAWQQFTFWPACRDRPSRRRVIPRSAPPKVRSHKLARTRLRSAPPQAHLSSPSAHLELTSRSASSYAWVRVGFRVRLGLGLRLGLEALLLMPGRARLRATARGRRTRDRAAAGAGRGAAWGGAAWRGCGRGGAAGGTDGRDAPRLARAWLGAGVGVGVGLRLGSGSGLELGLGLWLEWLARAAAGARRGDAVPCRARSAAPAR